MKKVLVWGALGHAKVLYSILKSRGHDIGAFMDINPLIHSFLPGIPIFHQWETLLSSIKEPNNKLLSFAVGIGGFKGQDRIELHTQLTQLGLNPLTLVHERAWVAETAILHPGSQILGMSAISEEVQIGTQTIINTNATVGHETWVGKGVHVMPGATIAGCCTLHDFSNIGSNATVLPRIQIGVGAVVGAGAVVTKNVPDFCVVKGVPARRVS